MVKVVVHCSDSGFGNAALIGKWHLENGWSGIGYHYVILNGWLASGIYNSNYNGHIETGRPLNDDPFISKKEMGAHVRSHNTGSVGVCLIGRSGSFTDEQRLSLLDVLYQLEEQFSEIDVFQHSDLDPNKPNCAGLITGEIISNYEIYKTKRSIDRFR